MPSEPAPAEPRRIVMVAAVADNGVVGDGPDIPWRIPGEQREFKALTTGHTLLMGRTTFESIGRPLPGRTTIVLTSDTTWSYDGVLVAHDVASALEIAEGTQGDLVVAGGAQVYAALLPYATHQVLSKVHLTPSGDAFYPRLDPEEWGVERREPHDAYDRVFLVRKGEEDR